MSQNDNKQNDLNIVEKNEPEIDTDSGDDVVFEENIEAVGADYAAKIAKLKARIKELEAKNSLARPRDTRNHPRQAMVPILPELQRIFLPCDRPLRHDEGDSALSEASHPMPSLEPGRYRPYSRKIDAYLQAFKYSLQS
jgi:hypothetical protein